MHQEDCLHLPPCFTDGVPERNSAASKLSSREFDPLQEQARLKRNHSGETIGSVNVKEEAQPEGNTGYGALLSEVYLQAVGSVTWVTIAVFFL
jgi:hypothetical protein